MNVFIVTNKYGMVISQTSLPTKLTHHVTYVTGYAKACIVHTFNFSTLKIQVDILETCRVYRATIPLSFLQISDLCTVPTRFYESLNEKNQIPNPVTYSYNISTIIRYKISYQGNFL